MSPPLPWAEPFSCALALRDEPGLVLLESMPGFGGLGRRSLLAARPAEVRTEGLDALRTIGSGNREPEPRASRGDRPSGGWWAGWLSYDLGRQIERLPVAARDDLGLPALALGRYHAHLSFDHARRRVSVIGEGETEHLVRALERAGRVRTPPHRPPARWRGSLPREEYERAVGRAIEYIRAGDVFQVNLSHRLDAPWSGDPFGLYARLRRWSPSPFMALVRIGGADVISASPERFLRRRGSLLETRPIKGTRPRGASPRADRLFRAALEASSKDRAENTMIVDLARNDLGRVCRYGSVRVPSLCAIETHPGVHHLVSVVEGETAGATGPAEIIEATFPPGSVTGAPKVRALEIIEELEPVRRGVYCGAIGWLDPGGDLELSVAIRTFVASASRLHLHVGGAVVADSDPADEWAETMYKAARLLEASGGELTEAGAGRRRIRRATALAS